MFFLLFHIRKNFWKALNKFILYGTGWDSIREVKKHDVERRLDIQGGNTLDPMAVMIRHTTLSLRPLI